MTPRRRVVQCAVIGCLVIASFSAGRATETLTPDAAWWRDLSPHDRATSVIGLVEGYSEGYLSGHAAGAVALLRTLSPQSQGTLMTDGRYLKVLVSSDLSLSKTYGTYSDELTHFYENYPALSDLPVGRILQCMTDHPRQSCDDYAATVLKARSSPAP